MKILAERAGLILFQFPPWNTKFQADYMEDNPAVKHSGEWRLYQLTYHTHRQGRPIKATRQQPRYKVLGYYGTSDECIEAARKYMFVPAL